MQTDHEQTNRQQDMAGEELVSEPASSRSSKSHFDASAENTSKTPAYEQKITPQASDEAFAQRDMFEQSKGAAQGPASAAAFYASGQDQGKNAKARSGKSLGQSLGEPLGEPSGEPLGERQTKLIELPDNRIAALVYGQHDRHLARIEQLLDVILINRGNRIVIEGASEQVALAATVLDDLYEMAATGRVPDMGEVDGLIRLAGEYFTPPSLEQTKNQKNMKERRMVTPMNTSVNPSLLGGRLGRGPKGDVQIMTRNRVISARSKGQADYLEQLTKAEMVFGVGAAGTGKTYLAVAVAVAKLLAGEIDRIILSRPAVEAGENLGFLPGDLKEKIAPYLRPLYDALYDMLPGEQVEKKLASNQIEIAPLAYMRGRTLSHACVILDEAQNTTAMQMKMFLTRFGENSQMIICGDPSQVDLPRGVKSGLVDALEKLDGVEGIAVTRFSHSDVVRHALVGRIVNAYEAAEAKEAKESRAPRQNSGTE